jgi:hypothetical protein
LRITDLRERITDLLALTIDLLVDKVPLLGLHEVMCNIRLRSLPMCS